MNKEILSAEKELELINNYTRSPLKAEDVYILYPKDYTHFLKMWESAPWGRDDIYL